ncbi:hypothetical protein [Pseudoalteromonas xiamenensis]|nr:hypothetical protein [Pseudoalteromonas xiamenensis]
MKIKKIKLKELHCDAALIQVAGGCPPTVHFCGETIDRTLVEF